MGMGARRKIRREGKKFALMPLVNLCHPADYCRPTDLWMLPPCHTQPGTGNCCSLRLFSKISKFRITSHDISWRHTTCYFMMSHHVFFQWKKTSRSCTTVCRRRWRPRKEYSRGLLPPLIVLSKYCVHTAWCRMLHLIRYHFHLSKHKDISLLLHQNIRKVYRCSFSGLVSIELV